MKALFFALLLAAATACADPQIGRCMRILERVESSDGRRLVGDKSQAIGILQIHEITVREANRVLRGKFYRYHDRWDPGKSRDMCGVVLTSYKRRFTRRHGRSPSDVELCVLWNRPGGRGNRAFEDKVRKAQKEIRL